MTEAQAKYIRGLVQQLKCPAPTGLSTIEAREWITNAVNKLPPTRKQLQHVQRIGAALGKRVPDDLNKLSASAWISAHIKAYRQTTQFDNMWDCGDRDNYNDWGLGGPWDSGY